MKSKEVKATVLHCGFCESYWTIPGRAKVGQDAVQFIKIMGRVQSCPMCGKANMIKIKEFLDEHHD